MSRIRSLTLKMSPKNIHQNLVKKSNKKDQLSSIKLKIQGYFSVYKFSVGHCVNDRPTWPILFA